MTFSPLSGPAFRPWPTCWSPLRTMTLHSFWCATVTIWPRPQIICRAMAGAGDGGFRESYEQKILVTQPWLPWLSIKHGETPARWLLESIYLLREKWGDLPIEPAILCLVGGYLRLAIFTMALSDNSPCLDVWFFSPKGSKIWHIWVKLSDLAVTVIIVLAGGSPKMDDNSLQPWRFTELATARPLKATSMGIYIVHVGIRAIIPPANSRNPDFRRGCLYLRFSIRLDYYRLQ